MTRAPERPATMTPDEVAEALAALEDPGAAFDPHTRLAWRPAWSIRSRKGAWTAFLALFRARV